MPVLPAPLLILFFIKAQAVNEVDPCTLGVEGTLVNQTFIGTGPHEINPDSPHKIFPCRLFEVHTAWCCWAWDCGKALSSIVSVMPSYTLTRDGCYMYYNCASIRGVSGQGLYLFTFSRSFDGGLTCCGSVYQEHNIESILWLMAPRNYEALSERRHVVGGLAIPDWHEM